MKKVIPAMVEVWPGEPGYFDPDKANEHLKCSCGSGEYKTPEYDGYGIFLTYVCSKCEKERMAKYREDILECYETEENI